jgi:Transposase DNA-binding/Transposase Tn5 dimerisation domain
MPSPIMEIDKWSEQQFGTCEFGDLRRTRRMVKLAAQAATQPDASTPQQTERWADCQAAYRLVARDEVTFAAVIEPHCAATRAVGPGTWLVINDTTEINFGYQREIPGVGRLGHDAGRGFFLHTALMVHAATGELAGMAAADLYARPLKKKPMDSSSHRKRRARESDVWGRVIDRVGPPPEGTRFIHIDDRGADNFEVYCHLLEQRSGWVIRAAQLKRIVRDQQGRERPLTEIISERPLAGTYELTVSANDEQPARMALMEVRYARVTMPRPKAGVSRYVRDRDIRQIEMHVVETREVKAPAGVEPLRWVLLTSEAVSSFAEAYLILDWYERRPLIEEYHKCLKTGCRVESRQYQTGARLAPVVGMLAVLAVHLLQLKTAARAQGEQPVKNVVPPKWVTATQLLLKRKKPLQTVRDFFRGLAQLGGFLARKCDGEPGWQTIWRGLEKLLLCLRGCDILGERCV